MSPNESFNSKLNKKQKDALKGAPPLMPPEVKEAADKHIKIKETGGYQCTTCLKETHRLDNMRNHVEIHLEGFSYPCDQCGKIAYTTNAIRRHKHIHHTKQAKI